MNLAEPGRLPDWEAFYRDYRKPGYVAGFEITTKLGGGMFGLVFRARRMSIGKDYAIKFLQVEDEQVRRAVLGELEQVKYFAQIDHPNLVSIEDRGEVDGIPFLVMAFAGTETLRDKMPAGRAPTAAEKDELLRYFVMACRGLAALHERSLVHFDVKPANVFLKGGVARVGDYGLSKLVTHSRGSLSMGRGTPYYMAPELLQRRGDHRSDVYSLGVLLYELLCGKVPFTGDSEWEVLRKHENAAPELPPHLTTRERALLQRCLAKDPAARFQSVHDLIGAFGREAAAASAPAVPVPADLRDTPVPDCVPPLAAPAPRPARATTATAATAAGAAPPPLPGARRATKLAIATVLVMVGFAVAALVAAPPRPQLRTRIELADAPAPGARSPSTPRVVRDAATSVGAKVDTLLATIHRNVRTAMQRERRTALPDFEPAQFAVPRDFAVYGQLVDGIADARVYSAGQAAKIERHGRPLFVAAVAELLALDYDDCNDCRRAANLQRLLGQLTAIGGLECQVPGDDVDEAAVCRFVAVADGWRRIAEQFARTDSGYRELLVARGKVAKADR